MAVSRIESAGADIVDTLMERELMKIRDLPVCRNGLFEAIRTAVNRQNDVWDALTQIERLCHRIVCGCVYRSGGDIGTAIVER